MLKSTKCCARNNLDIAGFFTAIGNSFEITAESQTSISEIVVALAKK